MHRNDRFTAFPAGSGKLAELLFEAATPNSVWVSDITYTPTDEGWLYLAGHKDIFNS